MNEAQTTLPKKSGCLKAFLISLAAIAFCALLLGALIWQSVSWLKNAPEPAPAAHSALTLSEGEQEDVERVLQGINQAKYRGQIFEETSITPVVFNGVLAQIIEGERRNHPDKKDIPVFVRGQFTGSDMHVKVSMPVPPENVPAGAPPVQHYINAEVFFNLEIVEGEVTDLSVGRILIRGQEAPLLARVFVNHFIDLAREENRKLKRSGKNPLDAIKLFKREGDRLHVILDGKKMQEADDGQKMEAKPEKEAPVKKKDKDAAPTAF